MQTSTKSTLKYFWQATKGVRDTLLVMTLAQIVAVILSFGLIPFFIKELLDLITEFSGTNRIEILPELLSILFKILLLDIIGFWFCFRLFDFLICHFESSVTRNLEKLCFKKIHNHSLDFFANNFVGSLVNKIGRFIWAFPEITDKIQFNFLPTLVRFIFSTTIIFFFAPVIAIILIIWVVIFLSSVYLVTQKYAIPYDLDEAQKSSINSGEVADSVSNVTTIKMFARKKHEEKRIDKSIQNVFFARRKSWFLWAKANIFQTMAMTILEISTLYFMIKLWINNEISTGTIVMIQMYLTGIYMNLWDFGGNIKTFYKKIADANEMTEILDLPIAITDPKNPEECKISKGEIEFKKVNFSYDKKSSVLKNFNLKIKAGERVGIVGESGAGKSTLTKLILRFSDIQKGEILIDNQNIQKITQNNLRKKISFVPQDPILFHRSLFENIKYGNLTASDEEVYQAAKDAHAHEFILNTSEKYKTRVGERGIKLSSGEKQRVAIARSMLKNTPILILDEATSSLDSKSEKLIQDALNNLMRNRTVIIVAHRLSTLRKMDRILVFDNGKVVEEGSHEQLLKNKGKYHELWNHQIGGFIS
ncbi:MAG: ABC transporter ATP-binding protein/permease [Candidatus Peregrinibacteria bacterium]|nr:ABC transporter ATP-binding protein/permease [Candidatus Peregrinibacteria bacterium]